MAGAVGVATVVDMEAGIGKVVRFGVGEASPVLEPSPKVGEKLGVTIPGDDASSLLISSRFSVACDSRLT